jgi:outer membrane immunogenic protein
MPKRLISSIAVSAFLVAASGFAFAQAPPPTPIYNWTGFYVGGNIGVSFGRANTDFNVAPVTATFTIGTSSGIFSTPGFAGSHEITEPSGFIGGGQIGYNWQFSPIWVAGLEADIQGADEKDSITLTSNFTGSGGFTSGPLAGDAASVTGTTVLNYQTKIDWFGTVRGRFGYVWGNGAVLSYVTGGLAYGKVDFEGTNTVSGSISPLLCRGTCPLAPFSLTRAIGHSQINTGWTIGSGTEGKLLIPGWTYKIEYLYVDLGTLNDPDEIINSTNASGGQITTHTHFTDNIIRAGLNYQFH